MVLGGISSKILSSLKDKNFRCQVDDVTKVKGYIKSPRKYKWIKNNSFPLRLIMDLQLQDSITHIKSGNGRSHTRAKLIKKIDSGLAYFLGAMRDGSLIDSKGMHWVRIYDNLDSMWIEDTLISLFKKLFDVDVHLRHNPSEKYIDISNKPLFYQLKALVGELHKEVPDIIKEADVMIQVNYLRGFFDAEGYVSKDRNTIALTQKHQSSLVFLKSILEEIDIKCGKIYKSNLPLYGKDNIINFVDRVGSSNKSKIDKLNSLLGLKIQQSTEAISGIT